MCVKYFADTGAGRDFYFLYMSHVNPPQTTVLGKAVNGTFTTLHSATVAWADGDTIELECEGTTIRAMKNGVALGGSFTQADSDLSSGYAGIWAAGTADTTIGDDFEAGNLSASVGRIFNYYYRMMASNS